MNGNGYKLLGYVAWQGGKWYLRRRLPSTRRMVATGVVVLGGLTAAALVARRLSG